MNCALIYRLLFQPKPSHNNQVRDGIEKGKKRREYSKLSRHVSNNRVIFHHGYGIRIMECSSYIAALPFFSLPYVLVYTIVTLGDNQYF